MSRAIVRVLAAAAAGAGIGAVLLMLIYAPRAAVVLDMDRDLPPFVSGFHPIERSGDHTFAWTSDRAVVRMAGVDRSVDWTCTVHARGARGPGLPLPELTLSFDGTGSHATPLTNEFQDVVVDVPARPDRPGLTLTIFASPTFVPGGGDPRTLGAQIDWLRCEPRGRVMPPSAAWQSAAIGTGAWAAAGVLAGASLPLVAAVTVIAGLGHALLLATGGGAFGAYPPLASAIALAASASLVVAVWMPWIRSRVPLSGPALVAAAVTAVFASVKLMALTHPAKPIVDALFQAHRLQWVLSGRYFFTQPLPDGVQFPYAIGLYVSAAPFASVLTDHVLLLRAVVIVAEAIAGALLYAVVVRGFGDRIAGVLAVVLFHAVPLPYIVIGNGNLTNAFAQAVALMAMATVALAPGARIGSWRWGMWSVVLTTLTSLAFLSHVSTVALLAGTLAVVVLAYLVFGARDLRRPAVVIVVTTALSMAIAVGLYYRHFDEVFDRFVSRVRAPQAATVDDPAGNAAVAAPDPGRPAVLVRQLAWHERASDAVRQTVSDVGWPMWVLAVVGGWHVWRSGWRRPVPLLIVAWVSAWLVWLVAGTLTRVDTQYQRYAAEFLGRINLASYPVAVLLAAIGGAALCRAHPRIWAVAGLTLLAIAIAMGVHAWRAWL